MFLQIGALGPQPAQSSRPPSAPASAQSAFPRGRRLPASAVFIYQVADGRLAEAWQIVDGLAFFGTPTRPTH